MTHKNLDLFYILLVITLAKSSHNTHQNTSDVYIISSGHAEAGVKKVTPKFKDKVFNNKPNITTTTRMAPLLEAYRTMVTSGTEKEIDEGKDDIVFVPNSNTPRSVRRQHSYNDERVQPMRIDDVMANRRSLQEVYSNSIKVGVTTEPPEDILFISGKNKDNSVHMPEKPKNTFRVQHADEPYSRYRKDNEIPKEKMAATKTIDCKNLECNNTVSSICGGKMENKKWKYRLFLNDCYFQKVNCGFRYEQNKYQVVDAELCVNVGGHYAARPLGYRGAPERIKSLPRLSNPSGRRSLDIGLDGQRCSHACPLQCTNDYDPECAETPDGVKRVFVNHCKLDHNSCVNGVLWYRRPMAECVGGQKADMFQNRAFINWMQKVGIVDNKGRLVLS